MTHPQHPTMTRILHWLAHHVSYIGYQLSYWAYTLELRPVRRQLPAIERRIRELLPETIRVYIKPPHPDYEGGVCSGALVMLVPLSHSLQSTLKAADTILAEFGTFPSIEWSSK